MKDRGHEFRVVGQPRFPSDGGDFSEAATFPPFCQVPDTHLRIFNQFIHPLALCVLYGHVQNHAEVLAILPVTQAEVRACQGTFSQPPGEVPGAWGTFSWKEGVAYLRNVSEESLPFV
jgi:hypothetical protein